jgi:hypothetical protein
MLAMHAGGSTSLDASFSESSHADVEGEALLPAPMAAKGLFSWPPPPTAAEVVVTHAAAICSAVWWPGQ